MEIKKNFCYEYPRPAVSADIVLFNLTEKDLQILLIQRKSDPFKSMWALPGGFMEIDETAEACAHRELEEETGLKNIELEQLHAFSGLDRDPRSRIVTIAHMGLSRLTDANVQAADDASDGKFFSIHHLPSLAFDHEEIIKKGFERLKAIVQNTHPTRLNINDHDKSVIKTLIPSLL
ncbi:MAG: NUDIX domain-containing protein [Cytophagaceae bacterium]